MSGRVLNTVNLSTLKAEVGKIVSLKPTWSTWLVQLSKGFIVRPCLTKNKQKRRWRRRMKKKSKKRWAEHQHYLLSASWWHMRGEEPPPAPGTKPSPSRRTTPSNCELTETLSFLVAFVWYFVLATRRIMDTVSEAISWVLMRTKNRSQDL